VHSVLRLAKLVKKSLSQLSTCTVDHVLGTEEENQERKEQDQKQVEEKEVARPALRPWESQNVRGTRRELKPSGHRRER